MGSQARILSFDEARSSGDRSADDRPLNNRARQSSRSRRGNSSSALLSYLSEDDFTSLYEEAGARSSRHRGATSRLGRTSGRYDTDEPIAQYEQARRSALAGDRTRSRRVDATELTDRSRRTGLRCQATADRRIPASMDARMAARPGSRRDRSDRPERADRFDRSESAAQADASRSDVEAERTEITAADRREAKRRAKSKQKVKAKAAEQFRRQFGDDASSSDSASSRAAVYKGEMGAKQRRATRMQEKEAKGFSISGLASGISISTLLSSKRFMVSAVAVICVFVCAIFLYGPAQKYYQNVREHDRLALEYQAVSERNEQLQSEVNSLQTDEGVRQRAHEQLGWVEKDEQSANVSGLNLESSSDSDVVIANVSSDSIKAPTTWYSPVLDAVFGYSQGE